MAATIGFVRNEKIRTKLSRDMQEKLKNAHDRLQLGQSYRQKMREQDWRNAYDQYGAFNKWRYADYEDPTADIVSVNISFSTINTILPFVGDTEPKFIVKPYSGEADVVSAGLLSVFMNRLWRHHDVNGQVVLKESIFDWLVYGDGYLKIGYNIESDLVFDSVGNILSDRVEVGKFFVERINPWDIWIDPYSDGIYNARWVAQRIVLPVKELLNDDRYKVPKDLEGSDIDPTHLSPEDLARLDDVNINEGWVTIYEYYDLKEKWMMTFLSGGTTPIRYIENVRIPIIQISNYRIPNSPYHMGELEQIESIQNELNKTRSTMLTQRRRNATKWLVRKHALTDDGEEALRSGRINEVIPIESNEPLDELITALDLPPLPPDNYGIDGILKMDVNEITGVNEYLRGAPQNIRRTATEASIVEGSTNARTQHKLNQIEDAAKMVGQMLLDIIRDVLPLTDFEEMRQFITGREAERLNRIMGVEDVQTDILFTPTPEIFDGVYVVEVEQGSAQLRSRQHEAAKFKDMVMMMMNATPVLAELGISFNMRKLLELWFEAEGIDDIDALFEPDEQQELMQQLALQEREQAAAGGGIPGGAPTGPGEPREQTTQPPEDAITAENSGML